MINERLTGWETQLSQQLNADAIQLGISWGLHCFSLVGSTMDSARELLESVDTTHPTLVLASQQMSGRGRQGRNWLASRLGFYGTYAFCLPAGRQLRSGFPLVTGAVLQQVLSEYGSRLGLKWPNDLLSPDGRKVSGTLIEVVQQEARSIVLTGIGINLADVPSELNCSVSLQEISREVPSPTEIAARLSNRLHAAWIRFVEDGFLPFREMWLKHALYRGCLFGLDTGSEKIEGIFRGVGAEGALILETDSGLREIMAGHVYRMDKC